MCQKTTMFSAEHVIISTSFKSKATYFYLLIKPNKQGVTHQLIVTDPYSTSSRIKYLMSTRKISCENRTQPYCPCKIVKVIPNESL